MKARPLGGLFFWVVHFAGSLPGLRAIFVFQRSLLDVKFLVFSVSLLFLSGCGAFSATTLRCGVDGDASYVEIASAPQSIATNTRALSELCGFAYEGDTE